MKTSILLILCLALTFTAAPAQFVTTIHTFTNGPSGSGPANPAAALTLGPDGSFYGTSLEGGGGMFGYGTLFKVTTNGVLTVLTNFDVANGMSPYGGLTLGPDGNFYGTTAEGGENNHGTAFQVTSDGRLTTLVSFNNTNGAGPMAGLALGSDGNFYGTAWRGGADDYGTVFQMTGSGTLTTLASFRGTNGGNPAASLTLGPDGNFYGTTHLGLNNEYGTIFQITTNGTLTTFVGFGLTNGVGPDASLTLGPDGNFYGTTHAGGSSGYGTVFKMTTNGTLTTLVNFDNSTNGGDPYAGLTLGPDGNFYGTTRQAGSGGYGTVFKMTTNGTLTTLASFYGTNGANPWAALTLGPDGNFYGTTYGGGSGGGTIFRLELPPDFITGPTNQSIFLGGTATFNCRPFGTGPFAYQWLSNAAPIAGATGSALTVSYASWLADTDAQYQVVVANNWGSMTSSVAVINLFPPGYSPSAITTIYSFTNGPANPSAGLTLGPDGNFYGTTVTGGSGNIGTVFRVTTNGAWTTLVNFNNANGNSPKANLALGPDGSLYGTTYGGGSSGYGTVFKMTTDGALKTLVNFNNTNGACPRASLTLGPDGNFYGTTVSSRDGYGLAFRMTTGGALTSMASIYGPGNGLTLGADGNFYGTTSYDGATASSSVFKITTNGTVTTLWGFSGQSSGLTLGPDGNLYGAGNYDVFKVTTNGTFTVLDNINSTFEALPLPGLTLGPDGNLYGAAGGANGTLFKVTTNGTVTTLVSFNGVNGSSPNRLALGPDGNFYGTTYGGGSGGNGTVFKVTTNGILTTLLNLSVPSGAYPSSLTLGLDGNFYGKTTSGGSFADGTVFKVTTGGTLTTLAGGIGSSGLTLGPDGNFYGTRRDNIVFKMTPNGNFTIFPIDEFSSPVDRPSSDLTLGADGNFYGVAEICYGDCGGVFKVTTNGVVTPVASLGSDYCAWPWGTLTLGADGSLYGSAHGSAMGAGRGIFRVTPNGSLTTLVTNFYAALTLGPDGNIYGTGGNVVFKMTTNGTLTALCSLNFTSVGIFGTALTLGPDGNFYGTTSQGGMTNDYNYGLGCGTVFKVTTNGTLTTLASFDGTNGAAPESRLTLGPDGNLYGTTSLAGSGGGGTIFRLNLPPDFTTNPVSQSMFIGGAATLTCQPFGTGPFAYQWLADSVPIAGATGSSLTVSYASWLANTNAQYQVVVANSWGSITSSVAVINLSPLNYSRPAITPVISFTAGSDGAHPYAGLTLGPDGNFYGTAWSGGTNGYGTAFRFTTNGTLTTLVNFNYANGAYPVEDLTLGPDGNLYGTTPQGGASSGGTVFTLTTNGTLTTLVNFNGAANGSNPRADLRLGSDGNFHGTTANGGSFNSGTVFKMTTNGTLAPLASFNFTNGAYPFSGLTPGPDDDFHGTTYLGGNDDGSGSGSVFKMTTNGSLTTLVSFNGTNGAYPFADLTLGPDGNFYGTTWEGGDASLNNGSGVGTVFKVSGSGTLTTLVKFENTNGAYPFACLALGPDGLWYGTTSGGGESGDGTVFRMATNGTLTVLASFNNTNGANPWTGLTLGPDGNFYGTTYGGGVGGNGTIFRLDLPPDFITGPSDQPVSLGGSTTFNCQPFGTGPFGYQWLTNGIPIAGATGSSLTLANVSWQISNAQLQVVITNNWGSILSRAASVVLLPPSAITTIYSFSRNGSDGANPYAGLTLGLDGNFYGTTYLGGNTNLNNGQGDGTVFQVTLNGALTTLENFIGSNGADPLAGLAMGPDGNFYGTTYLGGNTNLNRGSGYGTVFKLATNGTLTTLVNFNRTNGAGPWAGLTLGSDGNFYGTTTGGGTSVGPDQSSGTVFQMRPDGTLTQLATFGLFDGGESWAALTLGPDANFYGTTVGGTVPGGTEVWGSAFRVTTNGTLTTFFVRGSSDGLNGTTYYAGLALGPDGVFYGAAGWGGSQSDGLVFKMATNGTVTPLVNFANTNGAHPYATLTLGPDGNFYGTTSQGGRNGDGTVFKLTPSATLTTLANFNGTNGANPWAALTLGPDGSFYGTTEAGGTGNNGTIYRLNLSPDFITGPADQSVSLGGSATFNCQPFGTGPFAYQWLSNGVPIAGATGSSLTLSSISWQIINAQFQVVITNLWGSFLSSAASVHVLWQPTICAVSCSGGGCVTVQLASYPNSTNRLWMSTNVALPQAQWQLIATNITDSNGLSQFQDTNTTGIPTKFYRLSSP